MNDGRPEATDVSAQLPDPVVDIGIPAFGKPGYLVEAIESVVAQSLTSWRLIVSEDGAGGTDIAAVIEPYLTDPRIQYVVTGKRVGQYPNWTRLIQMGQAPYVALLHDDDRWQPEFLARRVAFLESHPECGFVFSATNEIDEDGNVISRSKFLMEGVYERRQFVRSLLRTNVVGYPPSVLVRRRAYEAVGPVFEKRFPFADYEMWFRIALRFPVGYLAVRDADYRSHPGATRLVEDWPTNEDFLRLLVHLVAVAEHDSPELLSWRDRRRAHSSALLAVMLDALEEGDRKRSLSLLGDALRVYPPFVVDPRVLTWFVAQPFGTRGRQAIARLRPLLRRRHRIRSHLPAP
jgi:glycosyltransferase involved in cell wall biosynthesis